MKPKIAFTLLFLICFFSEMTFAGPLKRLPASVLEGKFLVYNASDTYNIVFEYGLSLEALHKGKVYKKKNWLCPFRFPENTKLIVKIGSGDDHVLRSIDTGHRYVIFWNENISRWDINKLIVK